jgi:hypothetical protein
MSAEQALLVRSFPIGKRTVTISLPRPDSGLSLAAEWSPEPPRKLSKKEWRQYRAGRQTLLEEYAALTGHRIAVIEV